MAASQQAQQAILASALEAQLPAAWDSLLNLDDLEASMPSYVAGVGALVRRYGTISSGVAARYYVATRHAAGITGRFTVQPASAPNLDELDAGIRWATRGLWSDSPDIEAAQSLVKGVAERAVLDTGRNTLLDAIKADRKAQGWARMTEPDACSFCILLATRGAVYRGEPFKSHNNCRCTLEPIFGIYEPSAELRRWQALYREAARGQSGRGARRAFRDAVEAERSK